LETGGLSLAQFWTHLLPIVIKEWGSVQLLGYLAFFPLHSQADKTYDTCLHQSINTRTRDLVDRYINQ
jgi:hypothetical protein